MSNERQKPRYAGVLRKYVDSLEALEVVLALTRRRQSATIAELAAELSMNDGQVREALARLAASGAVTTSGDIHQWVVSDNREVLEGLAVLESAYRSSRFDVIAELASQSIERARTTTLRAFARAFIVRKKTDG